MSLQTETFYPADPVSETTCLVIANEFATDLEHGLTRHAAELAQVTGLPVLAYDRPGTGRSFSMATPTQRDTKRIVSRSMTTAQQIAKELPELGFDSVISVGHSAAAIEAVGLTRTDELPVSNLVITEPTSVKLQSRARLLAGYVAYELRHERAGRKHNTELEPLPKAGKSLRDTAAEFKHYGGLWASDHTAAALGGISQNLPAVAMHVYFAERSLYGNPAFIDDLVGQLNTVDRLHAAVVPDTYHSHFSRAQFLGPLVTKAHTNR